MSEQPLKHTEESSKARLFCDAYMGMGEDRSLLKLSKMEVDGITVGLRWLKEWSTKFDWQGRARAYDAEQLEKKRRARELQVEQMNDRHAQIGITQQKNALEQIQRLITMGDFGAAATVQLLKFATDIERIARGAATEQLALTGKDGGKVEMDVVVETFWGRGTDPRRKVEEIDEEPTEGDEGPGIDVEFGDDGNDEPWEDEEDSDSFDETNS